MATEGRDLEVRLEFSDPESIHTEIEKKLVNRLESCRVSNRHLRQDNNTLLIENRKLRRRITDITDKIEKVLDRHPLVNMLVGKAIRKAIEKETYK